MLDVVIPTATYATTNGDEKGNDYYAGVTKNAYKDINAKAAGYALLNNIIGKYDGTYWKPINDDTKILSGDFQIQVAATSIEGVSGNGLIYTTENFLSPNLGEYFNLEPWESAACNSINPRATAGICRGKNMLVPTYSEVNTHDTNTYNPCGGTGNVGGSGVPSSSTTRILTSTGSLLWDDNYFIKDENNQVTTVGPSSFGFFIRCVR